MDEELKKALNESGKAMLDWAQGAGAFVKEQAPLYIQELLALEFWGAVAGMGLGVAFLVSGAILLFKARRKWKALHAPGRHVSSDEDDPVVTCGVAGVILMVVGLIVFCVNFYPALKVTVAPRVVVVEKLQGLLR